MTVWLRTRRRASVALPRCGYCDGTGFLELVATKEGRLACPACSFELQRRQEAAAATTPPTEQKTRP